MAALINPKPFMQQNNIYKNKKTVITLVYSDDVEFCKKIDEEVFLGKTIIVRLNNKKIVEGSDLYRRILACSNGKDFFTRMSSLVNFVNNIFSITSMKDVLITWKTYKDMKLAELYMAYKFKSDYDNKSKEYYLLFEPVVDGRKSESWLLIG